MFGCTHEIEQDRSPRGIAWIVQDLVVGGRVYTDGQSVSDRGVICEDDALQSIVDALCDAIDVTLTLGVVFMKPDDARVERS